MLGWLAALSPLAHAQPTISITATDASSSETWPGQTPDTGSVRLTRSGSTTSSLTINARLRGTCVFGDDYSVAPAFGSTLTFPAGQANIDLLIIPVDDLIVEVPETVRVEIQAPNVAGQYLIAGQGRAEVNLADNDDANTPLRAHVTVAALNGTACESTNGAPVPGTFRISRDTNTNVMVNVAYTVGGTATPGADYTALSGSVVIPAGNLFADVVVPPVDDLIYEGSETVVLTLSPSACPGIFPPPPECYTLGTSASASLTILDNELPPPPPTVVITAPGSNGVAIVGQPLTATFTATDVDGYIASYSVSGGISSSSGHCRE